jgi:hypothetical protein
MRGECGEVGLQEVAPDGLAVLPSYVDRTLSDPPLDEDLASGYAAARLRPAAGDNVTVNLEQHVDIVGLGGDDLGAICLAGLGELVKGADIRLAESALYCGRLAHRRSRQAGRAGRRALLTSGGLPSVTSAATLINGRRPPRSGGVVRTGVKVVVCTTMTCW